MSVKDIMPGKGIKVEINGEAHSLRFTMSSLAWLAEKYGTIQKALAVFDSMGAAKDMGITELTALGDLVYAAMKHEDRNLTPEDIFDSFDVGEILEITPMLVEAFVQAMGGNKDGAANPRKV